MKSLRTLRTILPALAVASLVVGASAATTTPALAESEQPAARSTSLPPNALVSKSGDVVRPKAAASEVATNETLGRSGFVGTAGFGDKAGSRGSIDSIIGTDSRVRVTPTTSYPSRAIGLINPMAHCTALDG